MEKLSIITYVLDDDYDELLLMKPYLEKVCGVDVEMYTKEQDFYDAIAEGVHLCIIDHKLNGGASGIEVGKRVLGKNNLLWLILFTASPMAQVWQAAINAGFSRGVNKNDSDAYEQIAEKVSELKGVIRARTNTYNLIKKYQAYQ